MGALRRQHFCTTSQAIRVGTTVRYYWRNGDGLATVIDVTDSYIEFIGPECDGRFTHEQIDRLIDDDRLYVVLDKRHYIPCN